VIIVRLDYNQPANNIFISHEISISNQSTVFFTHNKSTTIHHNIQPKKLYDPSLLIHHSQRRHTLLILYVDDMLITEDDVVHFFNLKKQLGEQFQILDLDPLSCFLGIEVRRPPKLQIHTGSYCSFRHQ
jgi:hypothetical protein